MRLTSHHACLGKALSLSHSVRGAIRSPHVAHSTGYISSLTFGASGASSGGCVVVGAASDACDVVRAADGTGAARAPAAVLLTVRIVLAAFCFCSAPSSLCLAWLLLAHGVAKQ